jgi:S-adenosylmethionine-dependent methyltransferase
MNLKFSDSYCAEFSAILRQTYFKGWQPNYLETPDGLSDLEQHVSLRAVEVERKVIPWIAEVFDVRGTSILEIGCGTGSSSVPFALIAETLHACDVSEPSLAAARARARLLGADRAHFHLAPHEWASSEESVSKFFDFVSTVDVVLLEAVLEHLTIAERLNILRGAWRRLRPGGIMVVYETPNRLCHFDWHTFFLPFFHALPDELALLYAPRAPRPYSPPGSTELYRLGRGVSYHEFELAIGFTELQVINDGYSPLMSARNGLWFEPWERALLELLAKHCPQVPVGFARPSLDLVLYKGRGARCAPHMHQPPETSADVAMKMCKLTEELEREREKLAERERQLWSQSFITQQFLKTTYSKARAVVAHPLDAAQKIKSWLSGK